MAQLFARMLQREDQQGDTLVQLANRMGALVSAFEGQQAQLDRLIRLQEAQNEHNLRMVALAEHSAEHGRAFERFGADIEVLERNVAESAKAHAANAGAVRTLLWIVGSTMPIGILVVAFAYGQLADRIAEVRTTHQEDMATATAAREKIRDQVIELQKTRDLR
jgi:hypothetical protein